MYTHEAVLFPCVMYEFAEHVELVVFAPVMQEHPYGEPSEMLGNHEQGASPGLEVLNWLVLYRSVFGFEQPTEDHQTVSVHVHDQGSDEPTVVVTDDGDQKRQSQLDGALDEAAQPFDVQHEGHACVLQDCEVTDAPQTASVHSEHASAATGFVAWQSVSAKADQSYFTHVTERERVPLFHRTHEALRFWIHDQQVFEHDPHVPYDQFPVSQEQDDQFP